MKSLLTELLNIEGVEVTGYKSDQDFIAFEVRSLNQASICPHCGTKSQIVHQNHYHLIQDLPISGRDTFIRYNRRQFKCNVCKKPFSESLDFVGERRQYTERFAEKVVSDLIHGDRHNVAKQNQITDDVVESMVEYISKKKDA